MPSFFSMDNSIVEISQREIDFIQHANRLIKKNLIDCFDDEYKDLRCSCYFMWKDILLSEPINVIKYIYNKLGGERVEYLMKILGPYYCSCIISAITFRPYGGVNVLKIFPTTQLYEMLNMMSFRNSTLFNILMCTSRAPQAIYSIYQALGGEKCVNLMSEKDGYGMPYIAEAIRSEKVDIKFIFPIFTSTEIRQLLVVKDKNNRNVVYHLMASTKANKNIEMLVEVLGEKKCVKLLCEKDRYGEPHIAAAIRKRKLLARDLLYIFTFTEVQQLLNLKETELWRLLTVKDKYHRTAVYHLLMSKKANENTKKMVETLGGKKCVKLMCEKDASGKPYITEAVRSEKVDVSFLEPLLPIFTVPDLQQLLTANENNNRSAVYHILMSQKADENIAVIANTLGREKCVQLMCEKDTDGKQYLFTALTLGNNAAIIIPKIITLFSVRMPEFKLLFDVKHFGYYLVQFTTSDVLSHQILTLDEEKSSIFLLEILSSVDDLTSDSSAHVKRIQVALCYAANGPSNVRSLVVSALAQYQSSLPVWKRVRQSPFQPILSQLVGQKPSLLLPAAPSILLIFNTKNRDGAEQEADALKIAFQSIGLNVNTERDLTKMQTLAAIGRTQDSISSKILQAVIIMSHGKAGHINDNEGQSIPIEEIEKQMCPDTHTNSSKLLILQCCQNLEVHHTTSGPSRRHDAMSIDVKEACGGDAGASRDQPTHTLTRYAPINPNFCVIMSSVAGQFSVRNEYIPKLAEKIQKLGRNEGIYSAFLAANRALNINQTPIIQSTMRYELCLRKVLNLG